MHIGEGVDRDGSGPAQCGIEGAARRDARVHGGRLEASSFHGPNPHGRGLELGPEEILPCPGGQEPCDASAVAADRVVGDGGAGAAEGPDPGLGQAPEDGGVALLQGGQRSAAPLAPRHGGPCLSSRVTRTEISDERLSRRRLCRLSHDGTP